MKKSLIVFTLGFVCSLFILYATDQPSQASNEKIHAIEKEISNLQQQKQELERELKIEYHEEINQEMQSQKDVVEYDWSGVSSSLKHAEVAEHKAKFYKAKIHAVDLIIEKLTDEKEFLLQKHKGS
ncbi:MAG: hypothetical protein H0W50_04605 [Parachlamydiaceae bacterium]|nr:hypothetical protein [Parachlamydiaceae bacterium]